jgi:GrpB-like predicted nucleotidyltransferase (UPF0157 family)/N-acetylglutamate synthase-like GNAT family acetyltransferase
MNARIEVVPYDENWPAMFETEASGIAAALGDNCVEIHHVGSTSVPGLTAKPIIDIVAVAKDRKTTIASLEKAGYVYKGEWNIPLKCGFNKREKTSVNLHVFFDKNHPEIELNLRFCDYLRANPDVRDAYAELKIEILKDETAQQKVGKMQLPGYTLRKSGFIKDVIKAFGFDRLRALKCLTDDEWDAVKTLRQRHFFEERRMQDPYYWTFDHPEHDHFVLYRGSEIVGYAHIQLGPKSMTAILRIIVVTEENRHQSFGSQFLAIIEEWLMVHDYKTLYVDAPVEVFKFFKTRDYTEIPTLALHLDSGKVLLGKSLSQSCTATQLAVLWPIDFF